MKYLSGPTFPPNSETYAKWLVALIVVVVLIALAGCEEPKPRCVYPVMKPIIIHNNVPRKCVNGNCDLDLKRKRGAYLLNPNLRHENWGPSCVYASLTNVLETGELTEKVKYIRRNYSGGANPDNLAHASEAIGVPYAQGGEEILRFCDQTGRCAVIFFKDRHACTYMGICKSSGKVMVLDPNKPNELEYWSPNGFMAEWKRRGGFAHVVLEQPIPGRSI